MHKKLVFGEVRPYGFGDMRGGNTNKRTKNKQSKRHTYRDTFHLYKLCRTFYYGGPTVWNSLQDELRNSDSSDSFARFLKTILFSRY